jgi:hypothetical protein
MKTYPQFTLSPLWLSNCFRVFNCSLVILHCIQHVEVEVEVEEEVEVEVQECQS